MFHVTRVMFAFAVGFGLSGLLSAAETMPPPVAPTPWPRVTELIDGITFQFAPEHEALAHELAALAVAFNREMARRPTLPPAVEIAPLSIRDFRERRADYLARIAAVLGLNQATALQQDCYDGFLDNFEAVEQTYAMMVKKVLGFREVRAMAIWDKADLIRHLQAGEKIPHFTLQPDGQHVNFDMNANFPFELDPEVKALFEKRRQRQLDYSYNVSTHDGVVDFSARSAPHRKEEQAVAASAVPAPAAMIPEPTTFPAVITPDNATLPLKDLAPALFGTVRSVDEGFERLRAQPQFQDSAGLSQLLVHETTENGIVGQYLGSRDRRWLCEGVANYTAWKIARDRVGEAGAEKIYDVQAQLARYADLRGQIDLWNWPAVENQQEADRSTRLNAAHYAFATEAVFLMVQRHGEDFLPKLFREIGKTARAKTDMRTVKKAYKKLSGDSLDALLAAAVAIPVPAVAKRR